MIVLACACSAPVEGSIQSTEGAKSSNDPETSDPLPATGADGITAEPNAKGAARTKLDAAKIDRFVLSRTVCGNTATSCGGLGATEVDLVEARAIVHTCVEKPIAQDGGAGDAGAPGDYFGSARGDTVTEKALSIAEVAKIRSALGAVEYEKATLTSYDGPMTSLSVDTSAGHLSLSPEAVCGPTTYEKIVNGLPGLKSLLEGL